MVCTRRRVELLTVCAGATPRKGYAAKTTFRTSCRFRTSSSFRNEFICMYYRLLTTLGYREVCSRDQTCVVTRCKTRNEWQGTRKSGQARTWRAHTEHSSTHTVSHVSSGTSKTAPRNDAYSKMLRHCVSLLFMLSSETQPSVRRACWNGNYFSRIIAPDPSTRRAGCLRSHRRLSSLL